MSLASLYVQLAPGAEAARGSPDESRRLANERNTGIDIRGSYLQPLKGRPPPGSDMFGSKRRPGERRGNAMTMSQVRIFLFIALAVLLMGGINYVNLATARALKRAKEIAVRKVNGAGRGDLIRQFLGKAVPFRLPVPGRCRRALLPVDRPAAPSPLDRTQSFDLAPFSTKAYFFSDLLRGDPG